VSLIRTDVSEDRIASIFRVYECEQAQNEVVSSCIGNDSYIATRRHLPEDDNHHITYCFNTGIYCSSDKFGKIFLV
jgi:hypothetical protein